VGCLVDMEVRYYDVSQAGFYGGVRPLARYSNSSIKPTKTWLSSQDAYTLHKPVRKIFPRRKTFAKGIGDLYQADLVDMQNLSRYNDGYRYILTCIDVFSKRAFAIPLKDKRGASVTKAFETIFAETTPTMLQTDRGTEFLNVEVQKLFRDRKINHYWSLNDDIKSAVVERFNRTLKTRMFRYFTHRNSNKWVDVLSDLIKAYNNSCHRTIGMAPDDVTSTNENEIAKRMYPDKPKLVWKYNIGDRVRISKYKNIFEKGYLKNWSDEMYVIFDRYPTFPVTYGLRDLGDEEIKGKFYEQEIQLVSKPDDVYIVEKVLKTRKRNGIVESLIQWRGYPSKFNSWSSDVFKL
jgi:transposase InsO family protein